MAGKHFKKFNVLLLESQLGAQGDVWLVVLELVLNRGNSVLETLEETAFFLYRLTLLIVVLRAVSFLSLLLVEIDLRVVGLYLLLKYHHVKVIFELAQEDLRLAILLKLRNYQQVLADYGLALGDGVVLCT